VLRVVTFRAIRWGSALLEAFVQKYLARRVSPAPEDGPRLAQSQPEHQVNYEATVRRLVLHRERFAMVAVVLAASGLPARSPI